MAEERNGNGIRVSNSSITILLFLFAQTVGAVWWASSQNEKVSAILVNQATQAKEVSDGRREQEAEIQAIKLDLTTQIEVLKTYNQQLREKLASKGLLK